MPRFRLENPWSGVLLGIYEAETKEQALDLLAQDVGYANNAEVDALFPARPGEIVVTELE